MVFFSLSILLSRILWIPLLRGFLLPNHNVPSILLAAAIASKVSQGEPAANSRTKPHPLMYTMIHIQQWTLPLQRWFPFLSPYPSFPWFVWWGLCSTIKKERADRRWSWCFYRRSLAPQTQNIYYRGTGKFPVNAATWQIPSGNRNSNNRKYRRPIGAKTEIMQVWPCAFVSKQRDKHQRLTTRSCIISHSRHFVSGRSEYETID